MAYRVCVTARKPYSVTSKGEKMELCHISSWKHFHPPALFRVEVWGGMKGEDFPTFTAHYCPYHLIMEHVRNARWNRRNLRKGRRLTQRIKWSTLRLSF